MYLPDPPEEKQDPRGLFICTERDIPTPGIP